MPATIHMKNGDYFEVDIWRDNIHDHMVAAFGGGIPFFTYDRLDAGVPRPKITIDVREIAYVNEVRR
jgi:hypothetical protein